MQEEVVRMLSGKSWAQLDQQVPRLHKRFPYDPAPIYHADTTVLRAPSITPRLHDCRLLPRLYDRSFLSGLKSGRIGMIRDVILSLCVPFGEDDPLKHALR